MQQPAKQQALSKRLKIVRQLSDEKEEELENDRAVLQKHPGLTRELINQVV